MAYRFSSLFIIIKRIIKLKRLYKNHLILIATSGIGDVCYGLSVLKNLKEEKNRKVLFVAGQYTYRLSDYYNFIDETVILAPEEEKIFKAFFNKSGNIFIYNKISLKLGVFGCFPLTEKIYSRLKKNNRSYAEILSDATGKKGAIPATPCVEGKNTVEDYFENPDKTIIINTCSNSLKFDSDEIFVKIVDAFKAKGYCVYTNVVGEQIPLANTLQLKCSIDELFLLSKQARLFISIRSGIIDFCVSSGGNFWVLYDDSWNGNFKKAYTLHSWKTDSTICEFDYTDTEKILKTIENNY